MPAPATDSTTTDLHTWFTPARHTYAVVDARTAPQVGEMLTTSVDGQAWSHLPRGAQPADGAQAWCAQLAPERPLAQWLLAGPGAALGAWGVLVYSDAPFRPVRDHLRSHLEARMPQGERVALRWWRPAVLRALLPLCSGGQLHDFFGPVTAFAAPGPQGWTWWRQIGGQLDQRGAPRA